MEPTEFLDIPEQQTLITQDKLFATIWLQPRATIAFILKNCPEKHLWLLLILGSVANGLNELDEYMYASWPKIIGLIGGATVASFVLTLISSGILSFFGKALGGKASFRDILVVTAWAYVPTIVGGAVAMAMLVLLGIGVGLGDFTEFSSSAMITVAFALMIIVLVVWSIIIYVIGLSEANGFGIGRALLSIFFLLLTYVILGLFFALLFGIGAGVF